MIRRCGKEQISIMCAIVNEAAEAYEGKIPADRYHQPYMTEQELEEEIEKGVVFYGAENDGQLVAIMGIQDRGTVELIRHAYTNPRMQGRGLGSSLLSHLLSLAKKPLLVGTWKGATWAIRFYEKHGFSRVTDLEKDRLLREYWNIPARQVETSVVLAHNSIKGSDAISRS